MSRKTEKADALDRHIGKRIKEIRENVGMTQAELAARADVSYQQIHKYERGANRISAGRLGLIASILNVSVQDFYDGYISDTSLTLVEVGKEYDGKLCMEVARNFRQIPNPRYQEVLHLLVRILAS